MIKFMSNTSRRLLLDTTTSGRPVYRDQEQPPRDSWFAQDYLDAARIFDEHGCPFIADRYTRASSCVGGGCILDIARSATPGMFTEDDCGCDVCSPEEYDEDDLD